MTALLRRLADDERVRFLVVGSINTAFAYAVFAALHLGVVWLHYLGVLLVTHVITTLTAYLTQRTIVFRVHGRFLRDLPRFWSVYLAALGANAVLLTAMVEIGGVPVLIAQALVVALVATGTYLAHKHFSFRAHRPGPPPDSEPGP